MLKSRIEAAKTVIDIVGLIPELREKPKNTVIFYDKVKEITSRTTDETDLGILKTNFIDHPAVDSQENINLAIFILRQFIANADSYVKLEMIAKSVDNCADPNLTSYYEEAKASFGLPQS